MTTRHTGRVSQRGDQAGLPLPATQTPGAPLTTLHDFTARTLRGEDKPLADYAGKVVLVVNTASKCGLCLLYTSDAADERSSVDLGGRRIIKKKNYHRMTARPLIHAGATTTRIDEST